MDIVKKNLVSVICGVVALVALIAVFVWPLGGYYEELHTKVAERAAKQQTINSLLNKPRKMPVFDPDNPADDPLTRFPSARVIDLGTKAQKSVNKQSTAMYAAAVNLNQKGHEVLVPGSLPNPNPVTALGFRRNYEARIEALRANELNAGIPPTPDEVNRRAAAIWESMKKDITYVGDQPTNLELITQRFTERQARLQEEMQKEMATKYKMYADPAVVLKVPPTLPERVAPNATDIWWAQVEYWITRDVVNTIKELNAKSTGVATSPVKNLLTLVVENNVFPPVTATAASGGSLRGGFSESGEVPAEGATPTTGGLPDPTVAVPEGAGPTLSATKRISNNLYDVVHFHLSVDIEADKIPLFLKTLTTNRFITPLRMEMVAVDSRLMTINGYVYGQSPVVTLNLDCEAVFLREWTVKLMPKGIKDMLGIPDKPPLTPTAAR
jgi:hypothetical protein